MPIYTRIVNGKPKVKMTDPLKIVPGEGSESPSTPRKPALAEPQPSSSAGRPSRNAGTVKRSERRINNFRVAHFVTNAGESN